MKIAVTSQNFVTVTQHAGKTRRFIVYDVAEGAEPVEVERFDLEKEQMIHEFQGDGPHPLDTVDVVISGSFGAGFGARMQARGIAAVTTQLTDPLEAVKEFLAKCQSGEPIVVAATCGEHGHGHGHQHGHHGGHGHGHAHQHAHGAEHGGCCGGAHHDHHRVDAVVPGEEKSDE